MSYLLIAFVSGVGPGLRAATRQGGPPHAPRVECAAQLHGRCPATDYQRGRGTAAVGGADEIGDGRGRGGGGGWEGVSAGGPNGGTEGDTSRPQAAVAQDGLERRKQRRIKAGRGDLQYYLI